MMYQNLHELRSRVGKGFTLIEILVVIAIMGILSAIIFTAVSEAQKSSRDKKMQVNLKNAELALVLYKEAHGRYPTVSGGPCHGYTAGSVFLAFSTVSGCAITYIDANETNKISPFLDEIPTHTDSSLSTCRLIYFTDDGTDFKLLAEQCVESEVVTDSHDFVRCPNVTCGSFESDSYAVYSPGAIDW